MLRLILKSFVFIILLTNFVLAEIVRDIQVQGNNRVNSDTIKLFSGIDLKKDLNDDDLNLILKNLYQTGFFSDVEIKIENSILIFKVIENPIIQSLEIRGIKNNTLKSIVANNILLKEKRPYTELDAVKSTNIINDLLQESGYYFSNVKLLKTNNLNSIDIVLDIDLGKKAFIKNIKFVGDKKYKKRKLLNVITSEENKFWKFLSNKRLLNKQRLELDRRLLINFYKNNGYYNVKVNDELVEFSDNNEFTVLYNIDAGSKFYFGDIKINYNEGIDKSFFDKINNKLNNFSEKKYSINTIDKILKEIEKISLLKDYENLDIVVKDKIVNNKIQIQIDLQNKEENVFVKKINILGNNVTIEDVIRNELDLDEGDPFNYALYSRSINNIKSLNIFKSVSSEIVDTENSFEKIININVEEKPTGSISIGAGVGTSGASTSFGIQENNFLGKGIQLDTNLFLSEEVIRGLFSYTKKKYKNTNKDLIFSVQSQETDRMADFGYKSTDTGFSLGTNFEYLDDLYFSPNLLISSEKLDTADSASSMLKKQEGSYQNVDFRYRFFLNKLDKSFQPSDGFSSSFSQTIPINYGDNQTLVNVYEIKNYNEYMKDQVLSLSFYAAAANSLGNNDVRVSDRLYLPASKLRGFESGKIGPVDSGDFIGGNYSTAFNAKANLPVLQNLETMDFNLFYDAANVWGVDYSNSIDDSNKIRSSTGLSVDWYTPIGPMNFSLSQPITKSNTDKTEGFRFQLGTTF
jgi:outer membrane protein insertion porin family